jgi:cation transport regulator ChaB
MPQSADDILVQSIKEVTCIQTEAGWLWYCDTHDTHGNADSEQEARYIARAHVEFCGGGGDELCDVTVWDLP